jgi:adenylate kinase family enzyme
MSEYAMRRIVVIGSSASGKTTLSARLGRALDIPHVELDAIHWGPNWTPAERDVFRHDIDGALSGECWVADGSYSVVRDIVWARADTLVWLDYPLSRVLWQLLRRTVGRVSRGDELWNGNRETWYGAFIAPDNLFRWTLSTHRRRQREYPRLFALPEYAHLRVVRLSSPHEMERWLAGIC